MKITINGKPIDIEHEMSLEQLLVNEGFAIEKIVVAVNDNIIDKTKLSATRIADNDTLDVMAFVGGG